MKKKIATLLISLLSLVSCSSNTVPNKILCPTGAPAAAFYSFSNDERFETNSNANNIQGLMSRSNEYALVVLDTISGISAINNGAKYKIASTITFGNLYIGATGVDKELSKGDKLVLFGNKAQIPYVLYNYLYSDIGLEVIFVNSAADAMKALKTGQVDGVNIDFALVAEPSVTANDLNSKIIINVSDAYYIRSGYSLMQASIFVSSYANKEETNSLLAKIESDIIASLVNPSLIKEGIEKSGDVDEQKVKYGVPGALLAKVTKEDNKLGLGYTTAYTNKACIDGYLKVFGLGETNEEIYYK